MMILYEVTITPEENIATEYFTWLKDHIQEILLLPGFKKAELYTIENGKSFCVHYFLQDEKALQFYLSHHAKRMRQLALDKFGSQFKAERRILTPTSSS